MKLTFALSLAVIAKTASLKIATINDNSAAVLGSIHSEAIPNSYIIKFKDHVDDSIASDHHSWVQDLHLDAERSGGEQARFELRRRAADKGTRSGLKHIYNIGNSFRGYAGHFLENTIEQIRNHPDIEYIERDSTVHTMLPLHGETNSDKAIEKSCQGETEKQAPWGLARLSHRNKLNFGTFNKYLFAAEGGEGVDAYVIDTGCNIEHVDFEGRAKWGATIPDGDEDEDGNGHGTHCSGTISGKKYGVAKKATIYAVKVLRSNGSGSMSDVIKGVEFAAESHRQQVELAQKGKQKGFKGSVANMSLGGGRTRALDAAVNAAVAAGIHFAVAAGNDNADACNYSPAAASEPLTVGATDVSDSRAYFSNYGKCTDIFAPGLSIQSTWIGSKYAVNTISGTSMASPHICGLLAYYLSLQPALDSEFFVAPIAPKNLKQNLISVATSELLHDLPSDTPNKLSWNGGGCNNFSEIVRSGSVTQKQSSIAGQSYANFHNAADEVTTITDSVAHRAKRVGQGIERFAEEIHNVLEKEIQDFFLS